MVSAIDRKLLRDFWSRRSQAIAIALVLASGVATFVMSLSMLESLSGTLETYYERHRFADVFAQLTRAPRPLEQRFADIPGVAHVETRVVEQVTLDMPGLREPAAGRIISLPEDPRFGLNRLYMKSGAIPDERGGRNVIVSEAFANAHGLEPGDRVDAILNGRLESLQVAGTALSPEFIYLIGPGALFPDDLRYGVFWMRRDEIDAAFDMEGAFNDVTIRLMPGANEAAVIDRLDKLTDRYGGLGAYGRKDQVSHQFVMNEINELRGMTIIMPVIFLGVAAFLLNIVLSRMIAVQREQIAALKALGYRRFEIGRHYFLFVMLITLLAFVAGSAIGAWMGRGLTELYANFFHFPVFAYEIRPAVLILAFLVSSVAATIGVVHALRAAMNLPPAEAMRPQAPATFRPTIAERIGIERLLPTALRMILRQLERRPVKTALSCFGMALATAILVGGSFMEDAVDYIMDHQFNRVQRYACDVVFTNQTDGSALSSIRAMPGVLRCEPYRAVPVRMRSGHRERRVGIMGLTDDDGLYRLLDVEGHPVRLPEAGVVLSETLARILEVGVGDEVTVDVLEGRRPTVTAPVTALIKDFAGMTAYAHVDALNRLLEERDAFGGVFLAVDERHADTLYNELRETPRVAAVNVKSAALASFRETIAESLLLMRAFIVAFAMIIAFGVVYNSARISLSERSRDLATLRVIGFTRAEVAAIQLGELALLTVVAIPVGLVIGYGLAWLTTKATESELFRIPFVVDRSTFVLASVVVVIAATASALIVRRRLDRLDLVGVLKSRE